VAELVRPGLTCDALAADMDAARARIRAAYRAVIDAGTLRALDEPTAPGELRSAARGLR